MKTIFKLSTPAAVLIAANMAHAATATSPVVTVSLPVNAPTCTVANSTNAISAPPVSLDSTWETYKAVHLPTVGQTSSIWRTSATMNQTATISCTTANASITSFIVQPAASSVLVSNYTGIQSLVDTSSTPLKAFGDMWLAAEQVSVNGAAAPFAYTKDFTGTLQSYATPFTTGALDDTATPPMSRATVVWRPQFSVSSSTAKISNPTGGAYNGSFQIVVNY